MTRIALIGYGYWGPNLARCVAASPTAELSRICDHSADRAAAAGAAFPTTCVSTDPLDALLDPAIDAMVLATPTATHADLACRALALGKHVLVEKPMAESLAAALAMTRTAGQSDRVLMIDHTYLFSPAFATVRRTIADHGLGPLRSYHSIRWNCFGPSHEVSVLWDLAVHDLAMIDALMGAPPGSLRVLENGHGVELALAWPGEASARIGVSWSAQEKVRRVTLGFDRHLLAWDDLASDGRILLFDRPLAGVDEHGAPSLPASSPERIAVPPGEPLARVIASFLACIRGEADSPSPGELGVRTVRLLEAAEHSRRSDTPGTGIALSASAA